MILTVNNLAKTYKLLPSEVLERASTFDLFVLDVATRYTRHQQDIADGKSVAHKHTKNELLEMFTKVQGATID
jgi:hypothetical protein